MEFNLRAQTVDLEHQESDMSYSWTYRLQHNTHFHILETIDENNQSIIVTPTQCIENETYWYRVIVVATDPGGLQSSDVRNLYPDCEGTLESEIDSDKGYVILPNPASTLIEIRTAFELGSQVDFEIIDLSGKVLDGGIIPIFNDRKYFRLSVSDLAQSMYLLRFNSNGKEYIERFVVSRN